MLTAEQIKTLTPEQKQMLLDMGFARYHWCFENYWYKDYTNKFITYPKTFIHVELDGKVNSFATEVNQEAQADLAKLREGGIV